MTYQPGIPTGSVPLNQDYLNIRNNFTSINNQFNVDHVPLTDTDGSPPNGYHEAIHLVPQSSTTATPGYGQITNATISDGINTDEALIFISGNGNKIQMTRNTLPVVNTNGYTFLPGPFGTGLNQGALILQWGKITNVSKNSVTSASFNINFPNACLSMQGVLALGTSGAGITLIPNAPPGPVSGFTYNINTNSGQTLDIFWWALGY